MKTKTIVLCTAGTAMAFLFVWEQVQATRLGYRVSRRRAQLRRRLDRTAYLRLELADLRAPARIAKEARRRLGMAPAGPESLVFLGSEVPRLRLTAGVRAPGTRGSPPTGGSAAPPTAGLPAPQRTSLGGAALGPFRGLVRALTSPIGAAAPRAARDGRMAALISDP